jgi:hypothetical protein
MKFRKKPVVIEAVQFDGTSESAQSAGLVAQGDTRGIVWGIYTLEGFMLASPGDWIIAGVKGERYPCKPDIFEATYEPAEP